MCNVLIGITILATEPQSHRATESHRQRDRRDRRDAFFCRISLSTFLRYLRSLHLLCASVSLWRSLIRHSARGMVMKKSNTRRGIRRRSSIKDALSSPTIKTPRRIANRLNTAEKTESEIEAATPAAILFAPLA